MSDRYAGRRERLLAALHATDADALLVSSEVNVRYLTGFTGDSSWLLLGPAGALLLSDSRYTTQIAEECPGLPTEIRTQRTKMIDAAAAVLAIRTTGAVGFEADALSHASWEQLRDAAKTVTLVPLSGTVEALRSIKDAGEVAEIREAVRLAERAFRVLTASLDPQMTEQDAARLLQTTLWRFGASGLAFPAIVAVGDRAALPHYTPGKRCIGADNLLLIDWGALGPGGYRSDLTRTVATGKIPPKLQTIYRVVAEARTAAVAAVRPGAKAVDVDAAARNIIEQAGFGDNFGHGLGHGIGLQVHEGLRLSSISEDVLQPGMVFTIEPGIYLPGEGGVRLEDDVLVTQDGCEVLSTLPRELEELAFG